MRFNPPPNWPPFPPDWQPGPDWQPDPSLPPPPPGWPMWVDDQYRYAPTEPAQRSGKRKWWIIGGAVLAVVALVAGGTVVATKLSRDNAAAPSATPTPFNGLTIVPTHPPEPTDFDTWTRVGDVEATFTNDGRAVRLESNANPTAAWAGLLQPGDPACSLRFTGRVRTASGGYTLGLTTEAGPAETDSGPIPTPPGNDWHAIDVTITRAGEVAVDLDGKSALRRTTTPGCGRPAIRISAGATEFADVLVGRVSA
ncbi:MULTISPECIES: hypothetical protein [Mycobacteriaceae]|uniref:hypothetical protein n=1 Tax=Mycobacteriaceae TaxID=1762 RepID=UPI001CF953A3|nr:hypothetical protein [Mycolicibacterium phocaicum]UCZ59608.1 hypothetical protein LHJ73_23380 [Mycolicibacterium phocaicum]